jgi:hypothetical protein
MSSLFSEDERYSLPPVAELSGVGVGPVPAAAVPLFQGPLSHAHSAAQDTLAAEVAQAKAAAAAVSKGGCDNVSDTEAAEMMLALRCGVMH